MNDSDDTQSRFDNRPPDFLSAEEVCEALGVKRATLYTYVSRGWIQRVASGRGRRNLYLRSDVERLRQRRDARSGHTATAAGALRWGEPVIRTRIASLSEAGIRYRGRPLEALLASGVSFEAVAELLWTNALPERPRWSGGDDAVGPSAQAPPAGPPTVHALIAATLALHAADPAPLITGPKRALERGRALIRGLCGAPPIGGVAEAAARRAARWSGATETEPPSAVIAAINQALILSAEHGLNASTFAARVAASTGADLYTAVVAGLCAFSGPRHGRACAGIEAILDVVDGPGDARRWVEGRYRAGEQVPGFVHRLYPRGDPRGGPLMADAAALGGGRDRDTLIAVAEVMREAGWRTPTIDYGLVALTRALGWPRGSATWLFAVGRCAGWVAHALEQRASGTLLRPRATYDGAPPVVFSGGSTSGR